MLQRLEKLAEAAEAASRSFEQSSNQFEKTCAMAQLDLPPVMESIEKASKEFEELGLHLRIMTGGKRKPAAPKPPAPPSGAQSHSPTELLRASPQSASRPEMYTEHPWMSIMNGVLPGHGRTIGLT